MVTGSQAPGKRTERRPQAAPFLEPQKQPNIAHAGAAQLAPGPNPYFSSPPQLQPGPHPGYDKGGIPHQQAPLYDPSTGAGLAFAAPFDSDDPFNYRPPEGYQFDPNTYMGPEGGPTPEVAAKRSQGAGRQMLNASAFAAYSQSVGGPGPSPMARAHIKQSV